MRNTKMWHKIQTYDKKIIKYVKYEKIKRNPLTFSNYNAN